MMYKSRKGVTDIATSVIVLMTYLIYALFIGTPGADDIRGWAVLMLIFVFIAIIAQIAVQVAFHFAFSARLAAKGRENGGEKADRIISSEMVADEMDKQIRLRSAYWGYTLVGIGFIVALVALVLEFSAVAALNIVFVSFFIGLVTAGMVSVNLYTKGIRTVG